MDGLGRVRRRRKKRLRGHYDLLTTRASTTAPAGGSVTRRGSWCAPPAPSALPPTAVWRSVAPQLFFHPTLITPHPPREIHPRAARVACIVCATWKPSLQSPRAVSALATTVARLRKQTF